MIKILELFAGIGACSKALERLGIEHEIVDAVEIDKYAVKSFNAIHGTNFEPQDITKWDKDIECDLIMHGSPCQDFSVAGKQAGGDEGSGTRSSLMYETLRIVKKLKPKYVIWENVKNLLSQKHRHNFDAYIEVMSELGYVSKFQILNAKNYGIPQNRERVFTVSVREDKVIYDDYNRNVRKDQNTIGTLTTNCGASALRNGWKVIELVNDFEFPEPILLHKRLKDILESNVDEKFYLNDKTIKTFQRNFGSKGKEVKLDGITPTLTSSMGTGGGNMPICKVVGVSVSKQGKEISGETDVANTLLARDYKGFGNQAMTGVKVIGRVDIKGHDYLKRVYDKNGCSPTLSTMQGGNTEPKIVDDTYKNREPREYSDNAPTLRSGRSGLKVSEPYRIRKLTPKECWRLMGFDDEDFEKAEKVNSNSQLYKQAGNSIVVNVLEAIFKNLLEVK